MLRFFLFCRVSLSKVSFSPKGSFWALLVSVCLLVVACQTTQPSTTTSATKAESVNVSLFTWPGYGFWFIAKEKNFVPEVNLDIKIIEDPNESYSLINSGQLDVTSSTAEYGPIAAYKNSDIKLVTYANASYGADKIFVRPDIQNISDLKGKTVAVLEGGITQIFMGIWLEQNGVSFRDVKYANLIMDEAVAAFVSGSVAAAELWEPYGQKVLQAVPGARVVATSSEDFWQKTALLADGMYMSGSFVQNRPEAAKLALKAYYAAIDYWQKNPKEGNEIIARNLKFTVPEVELVLGSDGKPFKGGLYVFNLDEAARFMGVAGGDPPLGLKNGQIKDHWMLTSDWWVKFGLISKKSPPESGIAFEPLKALVAEQQTKG